MDDQNVLSGVEDTLYIPLLGRIYASEKFPDFFYDEQALLLKPQIPESLTKAQASEFFHMSSACRQHSIDQVIREFLAKHPAANIVFLGVGLETACYRLKNTTAHFYQIDLPQVIDIREALLGDGGGCELLISGDMFVLDWIDRLDTSLPTLISAAGVYQYFHEDEIIEMIKGMQKRIPFGELVFDATNSRGLEFANAYVKKTGNTDAQMYFSVDDPEEFASRCDSELIEVRGFFSDALQNCKSLKLITKVFMYFTDKWKRTMVIHMRFKGVA